MGRELPILMSPPMARAVHSGTKTQTRRLLYAIRKFSATLCFDRRYPPPLLDMENPQHGPGECFTLSGWHKAKPGDTLVVREGFSYANGQGLADRGPIWYWADGNPTSGDWGKPKPSIHMPRWAARSVRELVAVRVERLQSISDADAIAEGTPCWVCGAHIDGRGEGDCHCFHKRATPADYGALWELINGPGSWAENPWVVVLTFKGTP